MKVVVMGSTGQLGSELLRALQGQEATGLSHAQCDVTDAAAVARTIVELRPDVVINTAAFHKVEACEDDPTRAFAVNAEGAHHVARACLAVDALPVYISTDYVFSGDKGAPYAEEDVPAPVNVYGISKAAGEMAVRATTTRHLIVRSSSMFGLRGSREKGGNFIETMLRLAAERDTIRVVDDQIMRPSYAPDVAAVIAELLLRQAVGTYHVTNGGQCSWYELAAATFELAGADIDLERTTTAAFGARVRRPANSVLAHKALAALGIHTPRHWKEALADYIRARAAARVKT